MQEDNEQIPVPENSKKQEWKEIVEYMEKYFGDLEKYRPNGDDWIAYYKSARGYFKHSNRLPEEKFNNFKEKDYMLWEWILKTVKGSSHAAVSGGLYFRYRSVGDFCSRSSFYRSRGKFISLKLLIETPFKDYYILNPDYVIKLFNPKNSKKD